MKTTVVTTGAKYAAVERHLRSLVSSGQVRLGSRIPTEAALARQFDCSVGTVRRAMEPLVQDGLLRREKGSGTYVQEVKRQAIIGLVVSNLHNPDFANLVDATTHVASERQCAVQLCVTRSSHGPVSDEERVDLVCEFIDRLGRLKAAGVLIPPVVRGGGHSRVRETIRRHGLRYVVIDDFWDICGAAHHVMVDEHAQVQIAVDHLMDLGHRRIVLQKSPGDYRPHILEAFRAIMRDAGLSCGEGQVLEMMPEKALTRIFKQDAAERPTAVLTQYRLYAQDWIEYARRTGVNIPKDLSLVCLNSSPRGEQSSLNITATETPTDRIAAKAVDLLMTGSDADQSRFVYRPSLHVGDTTAAPACAGAV